jgi:ABC-type lipoprotein release transport system permease subunit
MGKTLTLEPDLSSIGINLLIIMIFSLAASFYPAWKACSIDPAQAIRSV